MLFGTNTSCMKNLVADVSSVSVSNMCKETYVEQHNNNVATSSMHVDNHNHVLSICSNFP